MPPNANTLLNRFTVRAKFRHMQVLIKLAELGSMRRASKAVNMTQPAISLLVAELEKLLETELFFRHARGVEPTAAARELLPVAKRILAALAEGAETVANRLSEQSGVVRIAASPAALGGMIHGRLDAFAQAHPNIQVHLSPTNDAAPLDGVTDESVNIICTRQPAVIPQGWAFEQCLDDQLIAACGFEHPFATLDSPTPATLGEAKWLLNRVGSVARDRFESLAAEHGWPPEARCEIIMHLPALTREMLVTGRYVAILPRSVALPWLAAGDVVELDSMVNAPLAPLGFLWMPTRAGAATQTFAAHLAGSSETASS